MVDTLRNGGSWHSWGTWKCNYNHSICVMGRFRSCSTGIEDDCPGVSYTIQPCNDSICQHPSWQDWSDWRCNYFKHGCIMGKFRNCSTGRDSDCTGQSNEVRTCDGKACPVPVFTPWGEWTCSHIDKSCFQTRTRNCSTGIVDDCQGKPLEITICTKKCSATSTQTTPTTTVTTTTATPSTTVQTSTVPTSSTTSPIWSSWFFGPCSATCGTGSKQGIRRCSSGNDHDCSGSSFTTDTCQEKPCGAWSSWFYGPCSATCDTGSKQGIRRCSSGNEHDCSGPAFQTATCEDRKCPVDGSWGHWQTWATCSQSCGDGVRKRHRVCDSPPPQYHGQPCHGGSDDTGHCHVTDCPHWGSFHEVGSCSVTCGDGVIQLQRDCSTRNNHDCTGSPYDEKPCSMPTC